MRSNCSSMIILLDAMPREISPPPDEIADKHNGRYPSAARFVIAVSFDSGGEIATTSGKLTSHPSRRCLSHFDAVDTLVVHVVDDQQFYQEVDRMSSFGIASTKDEQARTLRARKIGWQLLVMVDKSRASKRF